ncbi:unnamed protein product [Arabis nemorensis]|uniref:Uncharacterized protein n=1 Tax=Arabis nemorensis TaxID=586526 RepID=A0A565AT89_9BRAS|nr:unnamed protein product [Arabis nemorensis]
MASKSLATPKRTRHGGDGASTTTPVDPAAPRKTWRGCDGGSISASVEKFGPHAPSALSVQNILDLKAKYGFPDEVNLILPDPD